MRTGYCHCREQPAGGTPPDYLPEGGAGEGSPDGGA